MNLMKTGIDDILYKIVAKEVHDMCSGNPYTPGAGTPPAYLAGRDQLIKDSTTLMDNVLNGDMARHTIFYGVRGVGKTVLLNKLEQVFEENDRIMVTHIECIEGHNFKKDIAIACKKFLLKMSITATSKDILRRAMGVLKAFNLTWNPQEQSFSVGLDGDVATDTANSGDFSSDLIDLLLSVGETAKLHSKAICFCIDEIQSLSPADLSSLIGAIHRANQKQLPIIVFGAGLPTILRISSEVKSYSERLFEFVKVSSLPKPSAIQALIKPAIDRGVEFEDSASDYVFEETHGYPFFIQEYGFRVWSRRNGHVISTDVVQSTLDEYFRQLDESFYSSRYNRTTNAEKSFLRAMAAIGDYPCQMADVACYMGKTVPSISQFRANLMNKGLVYAPAYGVVDFTVPCFDDFLKRTK